MRKNQFNLAVCIGVSSDLAFAASVTFLNFHRVHKGLSPKYYLFSEKKLDKLVEPLLRAGLDVESVKYAPQLSFSSLWTSREVAYFSPLVLSKFEALRVLEGHEKVLWLDYDIVIRKPMNELLKRCEPVSYVGGGRASSCFRDNAPIDGLPDMEGVNAGLMLFNQNFPSPSENRLKLYELFESHRFHIRLPEQAVFSLLFAAEGVEANHLERADYCATPGDFAIEGDPIVLHTPYGKKFWNGGPYNQEWQQYYGLWQEMGGRRYSEIRHVTAKNLRKLKHLFAVIFFMRLPKPLGDRH